MTIRFRPWTFLVPRGILALLIAGCAIAALFTDPPNWVQAIILGVIAVTQAAIPILTFVGARKQDWSMKIGPDGVRWHASGMQIPWTSVVQIRASHSAWRRLVRPGVRLVNQQQADFAARAGSRPMASLIDTRHMDLNQRQVLEVIARYTDQPVLAD